MRINLKKARLKAGYTQKQLAELLKIDETSYQRIEYGDSNSTLQKWQKLSSLLKKTIDFLVKNEVTKKPDGNQAK